jgi:hypothetical protein
VSNSKTERAEENEMPYTKEQLEADYKVMLEADRKHLAQAIEDGQTTNAANLARSAASVSRDLKALGK